jgi:cytidine deaminase
MTASELPVRHLRPDQLSDDDRALVQQALEVRQRAYAPYSNFLVGAALRTESNLIHVGCNVENASYGLTNCAERTALFAAVAAGEQTFVKLAIASSGGVTPCGACRQVLAEFAPALGILLVNADAPTEIAEVNMAELLPGRFVFRRP